MYVVNALFSPCFVMAKIWSFSFHVLFLLLCSNLQQMKKEELKS
ncbi:hypothetical protein B4147_3192 [Bacillus wiedmannii]|uniref:Uncharacterized protein n=1 Tax=Bacillus wiedmannii TaxID=1890302 RepID=A0A0G8CD06_9BACI|nr:hypothetical protein B4147_3192 [Bacillus wiedmannii]